MYAAGQDSPAAAVSQDNVMELENVSLSGQIGK